MSLSSLTLVTAAFLGADDPPAAYPAGVVTRLDELGERAAQLAEQISQGPSGPPQVRFVLDRSGAGQLGADRTQAYTLSTYRFDQDNRDDRDACYNDWDLSLNQAKVGVRTVTDDVSRIWDLGARSFDDLSALGPQADLRERFAPEPGHLYLVQSLDGEDHDWALMQPLEHQPGEFLIFRYRMLQPEEWSTVMVVDQIPPQLMTSGQLELRIVAGFHDATHRLYATGLGNAHLEHVFRHPDVGDGVQIGENEGVGWVRGGFIPAGKALVVEGLKLSASGLLKGTNPSELRVLADGFEALRFVAEPEVEAAWQGRLVLLPGQEHHLLLEAYAYEQAKLEVEGELVDLSEVRRRKLDRLSAAERRRVDRALAQVDRGNDRDELDRIVEELGDIGPRLRPSLEEIPESSRTGMFGMAIELILRRLQHETYRN